ncbi:hypothetical protein CEXT_194551 [Caerostris extrusa]|uniref:Uncharacterized protein n=1 Tax=Caerostris extrusa TaxID=172846 RepID=A0AAV4MKR9_CAEEX|nr:hypothetical protein CEXT_194551 [Caerostris extrusa]
MHKCSYAYVLTIRTPPYRQSINYYISFSSYCICISAGYAIHGCARYALKCVIHNASRYTAGCAIHNANGYVGCTIYSDRVSGWFTALPYLHRTYSVSSYPSIGKMGQPTNSLPPLPTSNFLDPGAHTISAKFPLGPSSALFDYP